MKFELKYLRKASIGVEHPLDLPGISGLIFRPGKKKTVFRFRGRITGTRQWARYTLAIAKPRQELTVDDLHQAQMELTAAYKLTRAGRDPQRVRGGVLAALETLEAKEKAASLSFERLGQGMEAAHVFAVATGEKREREQVPNLLELEDLYAEKRPAHPEFGTSTSRRKTAETLCASTFPIGSISPSVPFLLKAAWQFGMKYQGKSTVVAGAMLTG